MIASTTRRQASIAILLITAFQILHESSLTTAFSINDGQVRHAKSYSDTFSLPERNLQHQTILYATDEDSDDEFSLEAILTEEASEDIAEQVAKKVSLPFYCPKPVKKMGATFIVKTMASQLSPSSIQRVGEFVNGIHNEETSVDGLAVDIASEIAPNIDLPILNESQELELIEQLTKSTLTALVTSYKMPKVNAKGLLDGSVTTVHTLLGEDSGRRSLAEMMNAKIGLPFLDEPQEQKLLLSAIEASADVLMEVIPEDLVHTMQGEGPESLAETKEFIVTTLNEKVDIVGLTEEQEEWLLENLVDTVVEVLIDDTETELLFMSAEEQEKELLQRKAVVERDLYLVRQKFAQREAGLLARVERLNKRLESLQ